MGVASHKARLGRGWEKIWRPGESGALARLDEFANDHLCRYSELRDRPDLQGTSRLSPHLHWGEISPRQIWARLGLEAEKPTKREDASKFLSEVGWREFPTICSIIFRTFPRRTGAANSISFRGERAPTTCRRGNAA